MKFSRLVIFVAALCLRGPLLPAQEIRFLGSGSLASDSLDLEGETLGSIGSGLAFDARQGLYLAMSDRGAGDGTIDFRPRFQTLRIGLSVHKTGALDVTVLKTTLLRTAEGEAMSGFIPDVHTPDFPRLKDGRFCIDAEAIALAPDGTLYIADEYGPFLYQFTREGRMIRAIKPPQNYLPHNADGTTEFADKQSVAWGRVPNHGFEGMAISSDGKLATLILQSGLIQDGGKAALLSRILVIDLKEGKAIAEYAYPMEEAARVNLREKRSGKALIHQDDFAVSELTAVNDHEFLVLERDNYGQDGSLKTKVPSQKCIYLIDLAGATNLLELPDQPFAQIPRTEHFRILRKSPDVIPVKKKLVLNFGVPRVDFKPWALAAKWEGIALTPPDFTGYQMLLISCDNDFLTPTLTIEGKSIPFPRAERSVPTHFLLFDLKLSQPKDDSLRR